MPHPVAVNIYDLNGFNEYTHLLGLGVYHSGLEVHGREYAFGGHDQRCSGIFDTAPREAPPPARFRKTVVVGHTTMSPSEVARAVENMGETSYLGCAYHLLERNCNSFVEDLCVELTGRKPPGYINRLARIAVVANQCAPCILPASVRAIAGPTVMPPGMGGGGESDEEEDDDDGGENAAGDRRLLTRFPESSSRIR